jgi:hypothetical protein
MGYLLRLSTVVNLLAIESRSQIVLVSSLARRFAYLSRIVSPLLDGHCLQKSNPPCCLVQRLQQAIARNAIEYAIKPNG